MKRATEPTHSSFLLDRFKLAVKLKSQGCTFGFSYWDCWQSATSRDRLHANTYLYSWAAVQAGASEAFRASVGSPRGIAFSSLVDLCGARSLLRQTGPGPGHGDIWLVCGSGAGCQGCRQHSSWTLAWTLQTGLFQEKHFGLVMWAFFHLNLVTPEYFQPACRNKCLVWSRDKEETRKKLFAELYAASLNSAYGCPQGACLQWMFFQLHFI